MTTKFDQQRLRSVYSFNFVFGIVAGWFRAIQLLIYQCLNTYRWNSVITKEMITVDAVATAAMVRFGSDAELDVTEKQKK